jgi:uncharacterized membrane protein
MSIRSKLWNILVADPVLLAKGYALDAFLYPNRPQIELPERLEWTKNDLWHNVLFAICQLLFALGLMFSLGSIGEPYVVTLSLATLGVYLIFCLITFIRSLMFQITRKEVRRSP